MIPSEEKNEELVVQHPLRIANNNYTLRSLPRQRGFRDNLCSIVTTEERFFSSVRDIAARYFRDILAWELRQRFYGRRFCFFQFSNASQNRSIKAFDGSGVAAIFLLHERPSERLVGCVHINRQVSVQTAVITVRSRFCDQ